MAEAVAALSLAETSPKTCSAHAAIEDDRDALLQNASNPLATSEEAKVNPRDSALIVTRPAETAKECRAPEAAGVPPEEALPSASRDDDLLSDLLVDRILFKGCKQGTRKINADYVSPEVDEGAIKHILRRLKRRQNVGDNKSKVAITKAVREFKQLPIYIEHTNSLGPKAVDAFDTHLKRYLQIYCRRTGFELCTTDRYLSKASLLKSADPPANDMRSLTSSDSSERATRQDSVASTSTSEPNSLDPGTPGTAVPASHSRASTSASALRSVTPNVSGSHPSTIDAANATSSVLDLAIRATKNYKAGDIIPFLKGSLADLTPEQDRDLREMRNGLQSDFSVLMNERRRVFQLFLGPARFCNHDCENNVEMFRDGKNISFRVTKNIDKGEEICSFYGEDYFDERNASCLCVRCEMLGRGAFKGQTSASTFLKDFGRRERRSKYQRDTRVAATHLGPRTSGWDDQPDLSDSEEDVRGRRYDDSDSDDGSPGPDGGLLAFASKDTAVTSRLRTWSWLPEGFVWDAFAVPEADITQPRQTRRGARESGAYIAAKTKMQVLIETAPTYTYDDWEDRDEREKIKKQARQRFDAETNELVDGEVADDEDEGRANLSSKRSKGRPDWQHLSRGSKKPLPPIYPIPAEDERQNRRKRIKVEHRIPEGADWRDYNLKKEDDEWACVNKPDLKTGEDDWRGQWVKGWRRADFECYQQEHGRVSKPKRPTTKRKRSVDQSVKSKAAKKIKLAPESVVQRRSDRVVDKVLGIVGVDGIPVGKDPKDYNLKTEMDDWQWFTRPSPLKGHNRKVWDCKVLWGSKRAEAEIGVQAGKVSQDVLTNWPQPCKEDALQSYRSLKWVMYDDQLKIAEAQVAEEALKATSDLSSCDDLGKDDGEDKRDQKIQTQEADKGEDADDERPDVAVSAADETVDGDTTMTAHHSL